MNIKKILFAVMCTLIVLTVVMSGIVVGRVVNMFQGLLSAPPATEPPIQETTVPTEPPTEPPTEEPTEPPTTGPTEPKHEHAYTKKQKVVAPNCINMGYTIYKCECGDTDIDDFTDPIGHEYGPGEEVTFCDKKGYTQYKCVRCSDVQKKGTLDPQHKFEVEAERVEATCTQDGHVIMACSDCGLQQTESKKLPATGHKFGSWNGEENPCTNGCGVTLQAADMKITKNDPPEGDTTKHYYIEVGTVAFPKLYSYVVEDHREDAAANPPTFIYVHGLGLEVSYTDSTGAPQTEYLNDGEMLDISADEET